MSVQMGTSVGRRDRLLQQVESFFREHLQQTRGASRHTVFSYRDSLQLFFCYLADAKGQDVSKLHLEDITENNVLAFLGRLEGARGNQRGYPESPAHSHPDLLPLLDSKGSDERRGIRVDRLDSGEEGTQAGYPLLRTSGSQAASGASQPRPASGFAGLCTHPVSLQHRRARQ